MAIVGNIYHAPHPSGVGSVAGTTGPTLVPSGPFDRPKGWQIIGGTSASHPALERAAVSTLAADLVEDQVRRAPVLTSTRLGAYLLIDDVTVLPVLFADALALPTAVRLPRRAVGAAGLPLAAGEVVQVGAGHLRACRLHIAVTRTFRPARVRAQPVDGAGRDPSWDLRRIGLGPGLTPDADDELAGRLLVAVAAGRAVPDLEPHLHHTTALSASLLRAAAQGYAVPEVARYVDAAVRRDQVSAASLDADPNTDRLRASVAAIGHTSGAALLNGIDCAVKELMTDKQRNGRVAA